MHNKFKKKKSDQNTKYYTLRQKYCLNLNLTPIFENILIF